MKQLKLTGKKSCSFFCEEVTYPAPVGGVEQGLIPELQLYFLSIADKPQKVIKVILLSSKRDQSIVLGEDVCSFTC